MAPAVSGRNSGDASLDRGPSREERSPDGYALRDSSDRPSSQPVSARPTSPAMLASQAQPVQNPPHLRHLTQPIPLLTPPHTPFGSHSTDGYVALPHVQQAAEAYAAPDANPYHAAPTKVSAPPTAAYIPRPPVVPASANNPYFPAGHACPRQRSYPENIRNGPYAPHIWVEPPSIPQSVLTPAPFHGTHGTRTTHAHDFTVWQSAGTPLPQPLLPE